MNDSQKPFTVELLHGLVLKFKCLMTRVLAYKQGVYDTWWCIEFPV